MLSIHNSKGDFMDKPKPDTPDTPDIDTIEQDNWESANALINKMMGQS